MKFYLNNIFSNDNQSLGVLLHYYYEPWYYTNSEIRRCYVEVCSETKTISYINPDRFIDNTNNRYYLNKKFLNDLYDESISD